MQGIVINPICYRGYLRQKNQGFSCCFFSYFHSRRSISQPALIPVLIHKNKGSTFNWQKTPKAPERKFELFLHFFISVSFAISYRRKNFYLPATNPFSEQTNIFLYNWSETQALEVDNSIGEKEKILKSKNSVVRNRNRTPKMEISRISGNQN